jgi:molybdopterin converting factor small subunit
MKELADNQGVIEVDGKNVGECLTDLIRKFPGLSESLFDNHGRFFKYIEIFVNGKTAFPNELNFPVKEGDELSILMLLAGG